MISVSGMELTIPLPFIFLHMKNKILLITLCLLGLKSLAQLSDKNYRVYNVKTGKEVSFDIVPWEKAKTENGPVYKINPLYSSS